MSASFLRVLGSADWHQTKNNDHSCYTLCDRLFLDACPSMLSQLLNGDIDPITIPYVFFTHMHCDHCMGLPPLLHYWRVCRQGDLSGLTLIGPKATLRKTVENALTFLFSLEGPLDKNITSLPKLIELEGSCQLDIPGFHVNVMDSDHAVPGLCYRMKDLETGKEIGFTGDTRYMPAFPAFFGGVDLLVHEASWGGGPVLPEFNEMCRHSSSIEAAKVCSEGKVKRLLLTHAFVEKRESALIEARKRLSIPVDWAMPHEIFEF